MTTQGELLDKDELIESLRLRIGELLAEGIGYKAENRKLSAIYTAAENLACVIGMEGEMTIHSQHPLFQALGDSFHAFDGGRHKKTMTEEYLEAETEHMKGRESDMQSFSQALEGVKRGEKWKRTDWNGEGMFIFLVAGSKFEVNRPPLLGIYPEGTPIDYHAHIDMRTAQGQIVPWLASQGDLLSDAWIQID